MYPGKPKKPDDLCVSTPPHRLSTSLGFPSSAPFKVKLVELMWTNLQPLAQTWQSGMLHGFKGS